MEQHDQQPKALEDEEIAIIKAFNMVPLRRHHQTARAGLEALNQEIVRLVGIQESDTGLAPVSQWDLNGDKRPMEKLPSFSHCILETPEDKEPRHVISINEYPRFVIGRSPMINPKLVEDDGVWESTGLRSRPNRRFGQRSALASPCRWLWKIPTSHLRTSAG